jgi:hypothetical protein
VPIWVRQQLADVAGVLRDAPERAKAEFQKLASPSPFTRCNEPMAMVPSGGRVG